MCATVVTMEFCYFASSDGDCGGGSGDEKSWLLTINFHMTNFLWLLLRLGNTETEAHSLEGPSRCVLLQMQRTHTQTHTQNDEKALECRTPQPSRRIMSESFCACAFMYTMCISMPSCYYLLILNMCYLFGNYDRLVAHVCEFSKLAKRLNTELWRISGEIRVTNHPERPRTNQRTHVLLLRYK